MVASSSGSSVTSGNVTSGAGAPTKSANDSTGTATSGGGVNVDRSSVVTTNAFRSGSDERWGSNLTKRSWSTKATAVPESARPYSSSADVHHALRGTITAPAVAAPQKAMAHSGKLRMA